MNKTRCLGKNTIVQVCFAEIKLYGLSLMFVIDLSYELKVFFFVYPCSTKWRRETSAYVSGNVAVCVCEERFLRNVGTYVAA